MNKLIIPIVVILIIAAGIGIYFVFQKPAEERAEVPEKPIGVPKEKIAPEKPAEGPKVKIKYCPLENLPEGWSVLRTFLETTPGFKIDNITAKSQIETVEYSVLGEKARRLCQVLEYYTVDEVKEAFNIKKSEMIKAGVYKSFVVGDEAFKSGGWVWIRVDRFFILAHEPLLPLIAEKITPAP